MAVGIQAIRYTVTHSLHIKRGLFQMNQEQQISAERSGPSTTAGDWGLRHRGLVMGDPNKNYVKKFTGMWPLKPDADLVAFTKALAPGGWINPPGESFSVMTTKLGLIRTARWFVIKTPYFDGYPLCSFLSSMEQSRNTSMTSF
jgi:hypothetical protein